MRKNNFIIKNIINRRTNLLIVSLLVFFVMTISLLILMPKILKTKNELNFMNETNALFIVLTNQPEEKDSYKYLNKDYALYHNSYYVDVDILMHKPNVTYYNSIWPEVNDEILSSNENVAYITRDVARKNNIKTNDYITINNNEYLIKAYLTPIKGLNQEYSREGVVLLSYSSDFDSINEYISFIETSKLFSEGTSIWGIHKIISNLRLEIILSILILGALYNLLVYILYFTLNKDFIKKDKLIINKNGVPQSYENKYIIVHHSLYFICPLIISIVLLSLIYYSTFKSLVLFNTLFCLIFVAIHLGLLYVFKKRESS